MGTKSLPAPEGSSVDWRLVGLLFAGAACLCYEGLIRSGALPYPLPGRIVMSQPYVVFAWGVVPFVLLPLFGINPLRYLAPGRMREAFPAFCVILVATLAWCLWAASLGSVRQFYGEGGISLAFLGGTFVTMLCGEFFFRGFLLFPFVPKLGWYAIAIGGVPYGLIHLGKPLGEIVFSIPFAAAQGYIALRSGSIWYPVLLHFAMATGVIFFVDLFS
jgi:membrane protease YdiL (CAAX protease family)